LQLARFGLILATAAPTPRAERRSVDALNSWFDQFSNTPSGAILMFLAVFLMRVALDSKSRKRRRSDGEEGRRKQA
jgi:hypothetical protein